MPTNTIPQALALFDALNRDGQIAAVTTMFNGAPTFDVVAQASRLPQIIRAWVNAGSVPADALALACARIVAASHALLAAEPVAPAPPPALTVPVAPAPVAAIPVFVPQPVAQPAPIATQPAQIAPVSAPPVPAAPAHGFKVGDRVRPNLPHAGATATHGVITGLAGAEGIAVLWDSGNTLMYGPDDLLPLLPVQPEPQPVARPVAAAIAAAAPVVVVQADNRTFDAATLPRQRGPVLARLLFADQPQSVIDRIPAALMVEYYADPSAPDVNPDYAFDGRTLASVLGAIAANENVWYHGPRGTGKTEHARQIAARTGRAFFRVNFNRSTDAEDILGSLGIHNGDTRFVYGPVAQAVKTEGALLLLDEPTYSVAAHFACLNPVLEKNGEPVRMPRTGEVLHIAPGVVVIAADNTAGSGATSNEVIGRSPFSADNLDRFQKFIAFDYMSADMERRVLRAMVKRACGIKPSSEIAKAVCKIVAVCRAKADIGELEGAPSLRRAVAFCVALTQGFDAAEAYTDCVINAAPQDSQEALRQIFAASWEHAPGATGAPATDPANPFADPSQTI